MHPLVVDLDGTLVHTDTLYECALRALRDKPFETLLIPYWLWRGKAVLKQRLACQTGFDPSLLPYNVDFLIWLKQQRLQGRKLVLCTAADMSIANAVSGHLGVFDEVMASDGSTNLVGANKANALAERFGHAGFDYAGNSKADLLVWQRSRRAVVVNASAYLTQQAKACTEVEQVFPVARLGFKAWLRMLRVHQWLKNLLLFVPLLAAHELSNWQAWLALMAAFCSFSLCASAVYITNDLLDLESDRQHPRKCRRPFAAGQMSAWFGMLLVPWLLLSSLLCGLQVSSAFVGGLVFYVVLTCAYSFGLKRLVLVDCLTLAMLYTIRIVMGAVAASHVLSFWLLAFAVFLFLSLAFVKRYAELAVQLQQPQAKIPGRGYYTTDASLIQTLGITSGYAAVLVLALYLNSHAVVQLYRAPQVVWGAVPVILFWISWMWLQAHRGQMHDDPLLFAVRDKTSLWAGAAFVAVLALGAWGLPW